MIHCLHDYEKYVCHRRQASVFITERFIQAENSWLRPVRSAFKVETKTISNQNIICIKILPLFSGRNWWGRSAHKWTSGGETETLVLTKVTCSQEAGYGEDISKNNCQCKIIELLLLMSEWKARLIFIFLVSVSPHKGWGIFRFITVRLHEIFHL